MLLASLLPVELVELLGGVRQHSARRVGSSPTKPSHRRSADTGPPPSMPSSSI